MKTRDLDMTAAFLTGPARMELRRTPVPRVGAGEVLLRVRAAGLCGSDARVFRHGSPRLVYPGIPGHELSGDIVQIGPKVSGWKVGSRVAVGSLSPCGRCAVCRAGTGNLCPDSEMIGYQRSGALAEYVALPANLLKHGHIASIPSSLSYDVAALSEPLAAVLSAIDRMGGVKGKSVVVLGSGGASRLAAIAARALGARLVVVCGRRKNAKDVVPCKGFEETRKALLKLSPSFDRIFVASDSSEMQTLAVSLLANRGVAVLFGVVGRGEMTRINTNDLHYREAALIGSFGASRETFLAAVRLLLRHRAAFAPVITHRFRLSEIHTAFGAMADSRRGKIVIHPAGEKGPV